KAPPPAPPTSSERHFRRLRSTQRTVHTIKGASTPPTHHPVRDRVNDTLTLFNEMNGTFTPSGQGLGEEDAVADARSDLLAKV
ncbi:hypothetical protein, partial [Rhodococcus sp. EPR-134]|uniref:hypothetical protein n=1 Tax=Rhodococcus sp. EPR-134 TaxID=1813675 RepID=UPI000AE589E1